MTTPIRANRRRISDPRVDTAWRRLSAEEPPESVDAAILAAARREVGAKPQRTDARVALTERRRWWPLAAAATIAAIAVGVLQLTPPDRLGAPPAETTTVTDMPTPAAGPAPETATIPPRVDEATPASRREAPAAAATLRADAARRLVPQAAAPEPGMRAPSPPPPAAGPEPFPAAPLAPSKQVAPPPSPAADGRAERAPPYATPPRPRKWPQSPFLALLRRRCPPRPLRRRAPRHWSAPPLRHRQGRGWPSARSKVPSARPAPLAKTAAGRAADAGADQARAKDGASLPVADWIALIRRLRDEGRSVDAARELAAFRAAHADHAKQLPPDLRDWRPPEK